MRKKVLKLFVTFLALILSSSVFAEPIMYICERPAWDGKKGCGPNNTYYTYGFYVDTDSFDHLADKNSFRYKRPKYVSAMRKGCDLEGAQGSTRRFTVTDKGIDFWFSTEPSWSRSNMKLELDTVTMTAILSGTGVKHGRELTCEEVKGEALINSQHLRGWTPVTTQPAVLGPSPIVQ